MKTRPKSRAERATATITHRIFMSVNPQCIGLGLFLFFLPVLLWSETAGPKLRVTHYDLRLRIIPAEETLDAESGITIQNLDDHPVSEISFALYRLLDVKAVTDQNADKLQFRQAVVKLTDAPNMQVNAVTLQLQAPLNVRDQTTVIVKFGGYVYGYPEVMAYVRDHVGEDYTLLRPDALTYPIVCGRSLAALIDAWRQTFSYALEVDVPSGYVAVSGGAPIESQSNNEGVVFRFRSRVDVSRIDVAAAKFKVLRNESSNLSVYTLPEDESGARRMLKAMEQAIAFYTEAFGPAPGGEGYTAIEIPEAYGSQAGRFYFLQEAPAFRDPARLHEMYHEIGHSWNAKAKPEVDRTRWFDEAFASYFEALAQRRLEGRTAFADRMNTYRERFRKQVEKNPRIAETAIRDYGKLEFGDCSYTKGAWSLFVLNTIVGDAVFSSIIREFLSQYASEPADFSAFRATAERVSKRDLSRYFKEWIEEDDSSKVLLGNQSAEEIANRYR